MRFLADEDFDNDILRGLVARCPGVDVTRVQDVGLGRTPDPVILALAAEHNRILLTRDKSTMIAHAWARVGAREIMAGVIVAHEQVPIQHVIEALELIVTCSEQFEWMDKVQFIPFSS